MNRTPILTGSLVAIALLAPACSGGEDEAVASSTEPTVPPTSTSTSTTTTLPPTTSTTTLPPAPSTTIPDVPRMPLTGEPISDPSEVPDRPALVVKITNAPQSVIPQSGLNRADLVIEQIINDNVTRLAAIYHSEGNDPVGPIRSGRAQDIELLRALDRPLFAWSGGNPAVTRAVRESDLVDLNAVFSSGYYRRPGRRDANNLFSSTEVLWAQTTDEAGRPPLLFSYLRPGEELTGDPATIIEITLDSTEVRWEYDPESGRYFREQNGREHTTEDGDDVVPVWTDNVVVMLADYGRNVFDGNPDAQVLGSNPVVVFTGGTFHLGVWLRFEPTSPFGLYDNIDDLNEIRLQPGRTWVEVPRNQAENLAWR
ncbi:MAG: DUF3048 domain-containing protein [Ilumatobacter sp.]|uniref:DUF3048 domain-containing protein n=1 Tax=Ilumatobacter sp. TaxID=1967498 RepID=UPI002627EBA3|nr:DUF3048 domain-containing protein [Ilumatobacter sp.]MDJ0767514.1 DUF3048 domain-containing protein [Ilumatobacter sp.]